MRLSFKMLWSSTAGVGEREELWEQRLTEVRRSYGSLLTALALLGMHILWPNDSAKLIISVMLSKTHDRFLVQLSHMPTITMEAKLCALTRSLLTSDY